MRRKTQSHLPSLRFPPPLYFTCKTPLMALSQMRNLTPILLQNQKVRKKKPYDLRNKKLKGKSERKKTCLKQINPSKRKTLTQTHMMYQQGETQGREGKADLQVIFMTPVTSTTPTSMMRLLLSCSPWGMMCPCDLNLKTQVSLDLYSPAIWLLLSRKGRTTLLSEEMPLTMRKEIMILKVSR